MLFCDEVPHTVRASLSINLLFLFAVSLKSWLAAVAERRSRPAGVGYVFCHSRSVPRLSCAITHCGYRSGTSHAHTQIYHVAACTNTYARRSPLYSKLHIHIPKKRVLCYLKLSRALCDRLHSSTYTETYTIAHRSESHIIRHTRSLR